VKRYHWSEEAACTTSGLRSAAWTEKGSGYWGASPAHQQAIRVCKACPVAMECLRDQLEFERRVARSGRDGIFGGLTPEQRERLAQGVAV
jgi:hypothetical protein